MTKCLLWLVLATLCVAFIVTIRLRSAAAEMAARSRENGSPNPYFVQIVEPKMRAEWERELEEERQRARRLEWGLVCRSQPATAPATTMPAENGE